MRRQAPVDHGLQYHHEMDSTGERFLVLTIDGYRLEPSQRRRVMQHANAQRIALGIGYWTAIRRAWNALYPIQAESLD